MKTYNPREHYCEQCGRLIITHNPSEYSYRRKDNRTGSPTLGKTLWFCTNSCKEKFERQYPGRKKYGGK